MQFNLKCLGKWKFIDFDIGLPEGLREITLQGTKEVVLSVADLQKVIKDKQRWRPNVSYNYKSLVSYKPDTTEGFLNGVISFLGLNETEP